MVFYYFLVNKNEKAAVSIIKRQWLV